MPSSRQYLRVPLLISVAALGGCSAREPQTAPPPQPSADYETLAGRFLPVKMPFDASALDPRERQLVAKLAEATARMRPRHHVPWLGSVRAI